MLSDSSGRGPYCVITMVSGRVRICEYKLLRESPYCVINNRSGRAPVGWKTNSSGSGHIYSRERSPVWGYIYIYICLE